METGKTNYMSPQEVFGNLITDPAADPAILHTFAIHCAERAMEIEGCTDAACIAGIAAKRAWLQGEITTDELDTIMIDMLISQTGCDDTTDAMRTAWSATISDPVDSAREAAWYLRRISATPTDPYGNNEAERQRSALYAMLCAANFPHKQLKNQ